MHFASSSNMRFISFPFVAHGILSPIEEERLLLVEEHRVRDSKLTVHGYSSSSKEVDQMFVDECEILDWDNRAPEPKKNSKQRQKTKGSGSHNLVEMANDQKTPLRIRDGEFGMSLSITKVHYTHYDYD